MICLRLNCKSFNYVNEIELRDTKLKSFIFVRTKMKLLDKIEKFHFRLDEIEFRETKS